MLLQAQIDMLHAAAERKDTTLLQVFVGAGDKDTIAYILSKTEWHTAELCCEMLRERLRLAEQAEADIVAAFGIGIILCIGIGIGISLCFVYWILSLG